MWIEGRNGRPIEAAKSRGGVLALARVTDNLILHRGWPPAPIAQKLYRSNQGPRAFDAEPLAILERELGYYCDLQSLHSEDAITWSFFGTLLNAHQSVRASLLRWLASRLGVEAADETCDISLWRRIPHPDTLVPGGPELDALLVGNRTVVAGEAKWRSREGRRQGKNRNKGQMQLRREFFEMYSDRIFGDRALRVVGVSWLEGDSEWTLWHDLANWEAHPHHSEFRRYYDLKLAKSLPPSIAVREP